jgi:hypothetical protein
VNERWVCKQCFADNEASNAICLKCGLTRGAEATPAAKVEWAATQAPEGGGIGKWLRLWWIPAIAIVLVVGYLASGRRDDQGLLTNTGTVPVDELRVGDCFDVGDEIEISEVEGGPCTDPHEYQVYHVQDYQTAALPTDAELDGVVFDTVCLPPFEAFVGTPYLDSALYVRMITPSAESFEDGDREYICVLFDLEDAELTTSMEGSNR